MIYIRATAKGEQDMPPLVRIFQYPDDTDEIILRHSVEMTKEKIEKNMKLNVNEALLLYTYHVAGAVRAKKRVSVIEKSARRVLSEKQVLIGVAETLSKIHFDAIVDGRREWVVLKEPIPTSSYIMAAE